MPVSPLQNLLAILKEEEAALLCGQYDQLENFAQAKEQAVQALDIENIPRDNVKVLKKRLERNSALMGSAAQGFNDASQLLARIHAGQETQLYDREGTRKTMRRLQHRLEHKA